MKLSTVDDSEVSRLLSTTTSHVKVCILNTKGKIKVLIPQYTDVRFENCQNQLLCSAQVLDSIKGLLSSRQRTKNQTIIVSFGLKFESSPGYRYAILASIPHALNDIFTTATKQNQTITFKTSTREDVEFLTICLHYISDKHTGSKIDIIGDQAENELEVKFEALERTDHAGPGRNYAELTIKGTDKTKLHALLIFSRALDVSFSQSGYETEAYDQPSLGLFGHSERILHAADLISRAVVTPEDDNFDETTNDNQDEHVSDMILKACAQASLLSEIDREDIKAARKYICSGDVLIKRLASTLIVSLFDARRNRILWGVIFEEKNELGDHGSTNSQPCSRSSFAWYDANVRLLITGQGVKLRKIPVLLLCSLAVGVGLTIWYIVERAPTVPIEELIQTAAAILALYVSSAVILMFKWCHRGESISDVLQFLQHIDTLAEWEDLTAADRAVIIVRVLRSFEFGTTFINRLHASFFRVASPDGSIILRESIGLQNLLSAGFTLLTNGFDVMLRAPNGTVANLTKIHSPYCETNRSAYKFEANWQTERRDLEGFKEDNFGRWGYMS